MRSVHDPGVGETTVNFIAFDDRRDACLMVLVEGPWSGNVENNLRSLQQRMYGCLDAALDGQLAEKFPEARGKTVILRIDCYDLPVQEVDEFVGCFAQGVSNLPDYACEGSPYVSGFRFEVNHDTLPK